MKIKYIVLALICILFFIKIPSAIISVIIYSLAVIPLAIMLGDSTSKMSEIIGEKKGGLLAATVGNIPELMMGIWSIEYGMIPMVKSAMIGSIIANMLLGLGISVFCGGLKYKKQKINKIIARTNFNMLLLAMFTMIVIACLNKYSYIKNTILVSISIKVSIVLIIIYALGLVFSLFTHSNLFIVSGNNDSSNDIDKLLVLKISVILIIMSFLLFFISEKLIYNLRIVIDNYNISQEFLGIILIPLLGNIGENITAIMCAMQNKINLSLETAIGSSMQIALFVTPILVLFAYFCGIQMTFLFSTFQIIISTIAIGMSFFVFQDGRTYWFEGAILISIYILITLAYYYVT